MQNAVVAGVETLHKEGDEVLPKRACPVYWTTATDTAKAILAHPHHPLHAEFQILP